MSSNSYIETTLIWKQSDLAKIENVLISHRGKNEKGPISKTDQFQKNENGSISGPYIKKMKKWKRSNFKKWKQINFSYIDLWVNKKALFLKTGQFRG